MAKSRAELEQEYQDVLKVSSSLLKDIKQTITDTGKEMKGMSSAEEKFQENLKKSLDGLTEKSSITGRILEAEDAFKKLAADKRRTENGSLSTARALKDVAIQTLRTEENKINAIEGVDSASQQLAGSINEQLDNVIDGLGPFGSLLRGPIDGMKESINDAAMVFTTQFATAFRDGKGGFEALRIAGGKSLGFLRTVINPVTLAIVAIGAAIMAGVKAFTAIDSAARKFREETGLLNANTEQTAANIAKVKTDTAGIGASFEDVSQAAADFTNEFRGIEQPSAEVLKSLVILNKNFGIATSEAAAVNGIFQDISGASQEAAQALTAQTVELANQVGVAPSQVIADIAANAETAAIFFGGSAKELASAAIEAAALGTSLTEAAKVSEGLLDFESSINAELEASAMLGQSINFNKARELAANNDIIGAQQAVLDQLENTVDLNNLNKFQLDSIAKASGIEVGELRKQLRLRERFGGQDKERLKAAQQLLESGKKLEDITESDLATQNRRNQQQQELQGLTDELKNTFGAIGSTIMDALAPVGKVVLQLLNLAGKILLPAFKIVGSILGAVFNTIGAVISVVYNIIMGIVDLVMPLFDRITGFFSSIGSFFGGLGDSIGRDARADIGGSTQGSEFSTPMAKGGIVTGPTNALIGEAGPEAVIPLGGDVMGSGAIVSAIEKLGSDIRQLQFQVNMDGRAVAEGVTKVNQRSTANDFAMSV